MGVRSISFRRMILRKHREIRNIKSGNEKFIFSFTKNLWKKWRYFLHLKIGLHTENLRFYKFCNENYITAAAIRPSKRYAQCAGKMARLKLWAMGLGVIYRYLSGQPPIFYLLKFYYF